MPTFEKMVTSQELEHLLQELYMLEQEEQLLGIDHSERIAEIHEALGDEPTSKKDGSNPSSRKNTRKKQER